MGWRLEPWEPEGLPDGVEKEDLQKVRITQKEYADGTADVVKDEWGAEVRPRGKTVTRQTRGAWRGTTWFFLQGVETVPGPARRRVSTKRPPLFVTEEWEYLKKLGTDPEFRKSALVDSLSVQGIERTQLVAAQRACPDLRAPYTGKLAEFLKQDPRAALLECQKESPDSFKDKKVDSVIRSLDKFELIGHPPCMRWGGLQRRSPCRGGAWRSQSALSVQTIQVL